MIIPFCLVNETMLWHPHASYQSIMFLVAVVVVGTNLSFIQPEAVSVLCVNIHRHFCGASEFPRQWTVRRWGRQWTWSTKETTTTRWRYGPHSTIAALPTHRVMEMPRTGFNSILMKIRRVNVMRSSSSTLRCTITKMWRPAMGNMVPSPRVMLITGVCELRVGGVFFYNLVCVWYLMGDLLLI